VGITVTEAGHVFLGTARFPDPSWCRALRAAFQRAAHNHLTITIDRTARARGRADVFAPASAPAPAGLTVTAE
jgi:hypothetical protein